MRFSTKVLILLLSVAAAAAFPTRGAGDEGAAQSDKRRGLARLLPASWECNRHHEQTIDLAIQRKAGEVVKGPTEISIPVNRLRYDVTLGNEVVVGNGPDFGPLSFIPALPGVVKTQAAAAAKKEDDEGVEEVQNAARTAAGSEKAGMPSAVLRSRVQELGQSLGQSGIEALADRFAAEEQQARYERQLEAFAAQLARQPLAGLVDWVLSAPAARTLDADDVVEVVFARIEAELVGADAALETIRLEAEAAKESLEDARDGLQATVLASDRLIADKRVDDVLGGLGAIRDLIEQALRSSWPSTSALAEWLDALAAEIDALPKLAGYHDWWHGCDVVRAVCNWEREESAGLDLTALTEALPKYAMDEELEKAQADLRAELRSWLPHLQSLSARSFEIVHRVDCGFPFFASRTTKVHVVLVDRLETDGSKASRTVQVAEVECPSHFSVTAGVGAALIDERDFAFVAAPAPPPPDGGQADDEEGGDDENGEDDDEDGEDDDEGGEDEGNGLTKVFGFTNRSSEQINPTFLISTRLIQCRTADLHLSFGTVLDLDRPDSSAVFGYLGGLTLSVKDQLFMTLGVQAQRVPELTGGFEIGKEVPPDLTEPPLEANWDFGPVLSVTYKVN